MPYPAGVAYRGGARGAASGLSNVGRAATSAASSMAARTGLAPFVPAATPATALGILARAFPWLLAGLTAYELYKLWNSKSGLTTSCGVPVGGIGGGFLTCGSFAANSVATQPINFTSPTFSMHWYVPSTNPNGKTITGSFTTPSPFPSITPRPKLANYKIPYGDKFSPEVGFSPEPWFDPWQTPINRPMPDFPPWPYRVSPHVPERRAPGDPINPGKFPRPTPRTRPGPGTLPRPLPEPEPLPRTDPKTDPKTDPPGDPKVDPPVDPKVDPPVDPKVDPPVDPKTREPDEPDFDPDRRTRTRRREDDRLKPLQKLTGPQLLRIVTQPAQLKPPGASVREVKLRSRAAGLVFYFANAVTEARDFIDAMWDALPKKFKSKKKWRSGPGKHAKRSGPTVQQMLKDLYKAIPELSKVGDKQSEKYWNDALDNLITNQIKDYFIGRIGSAQAPVNREMGRPVGVGAGPAL